MKFVPVIVTHAPTCPLLGLKPVIVGAGGVTVKLLAEVALPADVVTETFPVEAPVGTAVVIWVALFMVKVAVVPLKDSAVAPVRFVPVRTTDVPIEPLIG